MELQNRFTLIAAMSLVVGLSACSDDDGVVSPKPEDASYVVTVTNITNAQPLTPLAVIVHENGFNGWQLGAPVSQGLERLAESGDPVEFISEADADSYVIQTAASSNGAFGPGSQESVSMTVAHADDLQLSLATMLANSNDAFTGVMNWKIGDLDVGESATALAMVYDAGTENNSETSATMPGPAAGGEGYNSSRDDINVVTIHPGVVTVDDGLTNSALNESHRWLHAAAKVVVQRLK